MLFCQTEDNRFSRGDIMKSYLSRACRTVSARLFMVLFFGMFPLLAPTSAHAQSEAASATPPPVGQQLVREGTFALGLASAFSLESVEDEAEAESRLAEIGIMPRNGWIADYPVTPDIIAEIQKSVLDAAEAGKLSMSREEAVKRFEELKNRQGLSIKPYSEGAVDSRTPQAYENYPNPTVINKYYTEQGPPVVTYYSPPPDYYYLYGWVPFPFWWYGFWFPGYFILNDFHRSVFIHDRTYFVSNHFNDIRRHRVFRIDPADRFRGRTYAGIGVTDSRGFISTGVPRSNRVIFNNSHRTMPSIGSTVPPSTRNSGSFRAPSRGGGHSGQQFRGGRGGGAVSRGGGGAMQRGGSR
jgi:hypothetical protein